MRCYVANARKRLFLVEARLQNLNCKCRQNSTETTCHGWNAFCANWNEAIARRPIAVVAFFNASSTITWLTVFGTLSYSLEHAQINLADYAVGWLAMRSTVKLRQPLNLALATVLSKFEPRLSMLKVSPLLTAATADAETRSAIMSVWAKLFRCPMDRCGLAFFLCNKFTNVCVLLTATDFGTV
ncbi:Hypothetical protein (Fragment) [Durusdinium trenchii]|uniref:Uncharacterized protein n=1 Tax=Durusdinium trenchii TaxID=1381693 RepID=A0ABP0JKV3_9DINO